MSDQVENLRRDLKALQFGASPSPSASWNVRPSRPKPSLPMPGLYAPSGRQLPISLPIHAAGEKLKLTTANEEQERKLKEIMSQNGVLQINGKQYITKIDDMELIRDLGNGTCGHVVQMRHKETHAEIAVKQMRRTGNCDENKRILMDLDVVLKSHDCEQVVLCLGCFITDSDVWICMELMATCFDKLLKQIKQPIPEPICGKVAVATLKALNYLKEKHGVIHRDVKPSNILLDANGRVKLCDFGISGRLVDSKAKTRSAGCAAYMAPERIEPPNPNKPDYDIRADVWSLGITLVELAIGSFPYPNCNTDFEVLTKVLSESPPLLPNNDKFSPDFCSFIENCLIKDYKERPKYKKLLSHSFITKYEKEEVDVGAWYRNLLKNHNHSSTTTPNNNQLNCENLPGLNLTFDRSFKPQPSPRVTRAMRQVSHPSTSAYPAALLERDGRHSFDVPESKKTISGYCDKPSKPLTLIPSPIESHQQAYSPFKYQHQRPSEVPESKGATGHSVPSYGSSRPFDYYSTGPSNYQPPSTSSHHFSNHSRSALNSSPGNADFQRPSKLTNKFEFTNPSTTYTSQPPANSMSPIHTRQSSGNYTSSVTQTPKKTQDPYQFYLPPHHSEYQQQHTSSPQSLPGSYATRSSLRTSSGAISLPLSSGASSSKERFSRSETVGAAVSPPEPLRSPPSSSTTRGSYFAPSTWRSTLNSITNSLPSPMLLRRLRTASTDRSSNFDTTRRFQPSYRSWNEKDNFYQSFKR